MKTIILLYKSDKLSGKETYFIELKNHKINYNKNNYPKACIYMYIDISYNEGLNIDLNYITFYNLSLFIIPDDYNKKQFEFKNKINKIDNWDKFVDDNRINKIMEQNQISIHYGFTGAYEIEEDYIIYKKRSEIMIEKLIDKANKIENAVVFDYDKKTNRVSRLANPNYHPDPIKKKRTMAVITQEQAFLTMLGNLFIGEGSIPEQLKLFYKLPNSAFSSILMHYNNRKHVVFIKKEDILIFLSIDANSFMEWNEQYSLVEFDYQTKSESPILIKPNPVSYKYDIHISKQLVKEQALRMQILTTFPGPINKINTLLSQLTHYKANEYSFYYNEICIRVKQSGKETKIENFKII